MGYENAFKVGVVALQTKAHTHIVRDGLQRIPVGQCDDPYPTHSLGVGYNSVGTMILHLYDDASVDVADVYVDVDVDVHNATCLIS